MVSWATGLKKLTHYFTRRGILNISRTLRPQNLAEEEYGQ
jgi:hypothetical protein